MKTMKTAVVCIWLLHVCAAFACAAEDWKHIEGLPCEEVLSVAEDDDGYIWMGTRLGLLRYDGYTIKCYRNDIAHPYAFSSCNIRCIVFDGGGHLYAGSFFGLNIMDRSSRTTGVIHFDDSDLITSLFFDETGNIWVGTGRGLYLGRPSGEFHIVRDVPRDYVHQIIRTSSGTIAVITHKNGIYEIDRRL